MRESRQRLTAYGKDIRRSLQKGKRRFFAISLITLLGVMMFSGLSASCHDLRVSADRFFDAQGLHDLQVVSTLGLTEDDVTALSALEGVEKAEGTFSETVTATTGGDQSELTLQTLSSSGIDVPYILEGRMAEQKNECVLTEKYLQDHNLAVGDTLTLTESSSEATAEVSGAEADAAAEENTAESSSETTDEASGAETDAAAEEDTTEESAETEEVLTEHTFTIVGEVIDVRDVNNPFGVISYRADSTTEGVCFVPPEAVDSEVFTAVCLRLTGAAELQTFSQEYSDLVSSLQQKIADQVSLEREQARLDQVKKDAQDQLDEEKKKAEAELDAAKQKLEEAQNRMDNPTLADLAAGMMTSQEEQETAQQELEDGWKEYQDQKTEADKKFADAQEKIDSMELPTWYIQTRSSLSGYANIESDADSIAAIGTVFPIVFFLVAVMISLTTVTRMVEEDRGLIGTYKSLGYTDAEIRRKYLRYSGAACAIGSVAGTVMAFLGLPAFLFTVFRQMYLLPSYGYSFVPTYGLLGPAVFICGILAAAWAACGSELRQVPAALMRPRTPRAGSRILLEKIPFIWKRMAFLNKVTARNLFRYKRRMFMTVFGIAGCMALLLFGFALQDSVNSLMPEQYEQTYRYDAVAVASSGREEDLYQDLAEDSQVREYLPVFLTSATIENEAGKEVSAQMIVAENGDDLKKYIHLADLGGSNLRLEDGDILITRNAGDVLGFGDGDSVSVQLTDLQSAELSVTHLVQNYLGNAIYMTRSTYEKWFTGGTENGALVNLSDTCTDPVAFGDALEKKDGITSCTTIQELKDNFSSSFQLIHVVVVIIIGMSAALAFVVLFTLSTTNISERTREIATIKVLGFYDREVHAYIDKEVLLLSAMGVVAGLPLGWAFAQTLTVILKLPSIYLEVTLRGSSYFLSALLSMAFALIVNGIMNRSMNAIDPIEALKSVE